MKSFNYRSANVSDARQLSVLLQQVYIETYGTEGITLEFTNFINKQFTAAKIEADITSQNYDLWLATFKGNPVGTLRIEYNKPCPIGGFTSPEINKLYVLRSFSGMGIGQKLMTKAEVELKRRKISKTWLWVLESNKRALDFYRKQGYSEMGTAPFQMEVNRYTNIVMSKTL